MAGFIMRRRLVLAANEATYGTDAAPTPAANAILTRTVQVTPLAGEDIPRDLLRAYYGNSQSIDLRMERPSGVAKAHTSGAAGLEAAMSAAMVRALRSKMQ